jgi:predicted nucleic acid-binding protein
MIRAEKGGVRDADAASARAFAWGCLQNMRDFATAVGVDEADLWLASKYRSVSSDFEDNVLIAAAQRANADYLVTWDAALLRTPIVRTATPLEMLALIDL